MAYKFAVGQVVVRGDLRPVERERVRRLRLARTRAAPLRERVRAVLERHRDVEPAPPFLAKALHHSLERVEVRVQPLVGERFAGLPRERGVDERRLAVRDGIADDGVSVCHVECAAARASSIPKRSGPRA